MRLQITLPTEVADRARALAESEHRDVRRQIEKIVIDAMRRAEEEDSQRKLDNAVRAHQDCWAPSDEKEAVSHAS